MTAAIYEDLAGWCGERRGEKKNWCTRTETSDDPNLAIIPPYSMKMTLKIPQSLRNRIFTEYRAFSRSSSSSIDASVFLI